MSMHNLTKVLIFLQVTICGERMSRLVGEHRLDSPDMRARTQKKKGGKRTSTQVAMRWGSYRHYGRSCREHSLRFEYSHCSQPECHAQFNRSTHNTLHLSMPMKTTSTQPVHNPNLYYSGFDFDRQQQIESQRCQVWGRDYSRLPFPVKLHMLLSCRQYARDLWWTDEGKSFAVNREGYKRHIMSIFFDEHKYRSFQTLLHKYGFHTKSTFTSIHTDIIIYEHDLFRENDFELCKQMTRVRK